MATPFAMLYQHNLWANLRLLDACAALPDALLDAESPGSFGSIRQTLTHVVGGEERYASLLTGEATENPIRRGAAFPGFADLRERSQRSGTRLIQLAEAAQMHHTIQVDNPQDGTVEEIPAMILLLQAINHATEHRTNITTIMAQHGHEEIGLDGWNYFDQIVRHTAI
jgi:uncharacterized damage-inducible protein DinB